MARSTCDATFSEDAARNLEWRRRPPVEGCEHYREALLVVCEELVHTPIQVVKERTVPREDEVHVQTPQACKGV